MKLFKSALLSTALIASMSVSAETVRLVTTPSATSNSIKSLSTGAGSNCVVSQREDAQWCLPESKSAQEVMARAASAKTNKSRSISFDVDSQGYSAEEIAAQFNQTGRFGLVEVDVVIKSTGYRPNDPQLSSQDSYYGSPENSVTGSNVHGLWDELGQSKVTEKSNPVDVIVMDSVFEANADLVYFDGRGFSTTALEQGGAPQQRSDDYTPPVENADMYCNPHGLGVASVIGASIDNAEGFAGVTNNTNLYAIKVMTCGVGFLSDVSEALHWLAGKDVDGVTPYQGKPGIVNMSLGGNSGACPQYMQEGVDAAIEAGFTLVGSSGNDSIDASKNAPSNCDGVLSVAALDKSGDLASFSNFGSEVDVSAQGVDILGYCNDSSSACYWEGTSFASPLVAGGLAAIKQETGASREELIAALKISSNLDLLGAQCQTGICGKGLPDFAQTLEVARAMKDGSLNSIAFALSDSDECEQTWFIDNFGGKARMCELYKVTFFGGYIADGTIYELLSIDANGTWGDASEKSEGAFDKATVMLSDIDVLGKRYGFRACTNGSCDDIVEMDVSMAQEDHRPAICKE